MPPELLSEGQMSKAADVYAMGVLHVGGELAVPCYWASFKHDLAYVTWAGSTALDPKVFIRPINAA